MALKHAQALDVIDLHADASHWGTERSCSLLKSERLQLLRVVLAAGQGMRDHQLPGELTLQCLSGRVEVLALDHDCVLKAGQLVLLPAGHRHRVQALDDAVLLLTVQHP